MPIKSIKWPGDPIVLDDIQSLESRLAVKLPGAYRDFLLTHNGGRPIPDGFPIPGGDTSDAGSLMNHFFGVTGPYSIEKTITVFASRIPAGLLPIGRDAGGNIICMGTEAEHYGRIFFWDHDFEEEQPTWNNVYPLTDSFEDFIASFRDRPVV
jgi:cell wall assembly regulator SMI1